MRKVLFLFSVLVFFNAGSFAQEKSEDGKKSDGSNILNLTGNFHFSIPYIVKAFPVFPVGTDQKHIAPAAGFGGRISKGTGGKGKNSVKAGPFLDFDLAFPNAQMTPPVYDLMGGIILCINMVEINAGFGISTYKFRPLNSGSMTKGTVLDYIVAVFLGKRFVKIGLEYTGAKKLGTVISEYEGISTKISHEHTHIISGIVRVRTPFMLLADASVDVITLPKTVVGSSEFVYVINNRDVIQRFALGAGIDFNQTELWLRAAYVDGVDDYDAIYYQAPYLKDHYMLATTTLTAELIWKF
jgi:hypothetical protein